jgi:hypothetical protein
MILNAVTCLKHEGFREEREWRIIYSPTRRPSVHITHSIEVIDGVPQLIQKIPLRGAPPDDLALIDIPHLIERVIIGPTQFGAPMFEAFYAALKQAGVQNPNIVVSGIPIRT